MIYSVLEILLPIVAGFATGVLAKKKTLIDEKGFTGLKSIISNILIPVSLFNAMLFSSYSLDTAIIIVTICLTMYAIFGIGMLTRRFVPGRKQYYPVAVSTWEGGSMGIPLAALALGSTGMAKMALFDFGHAFFLFIFVVPYLQILDGEKPTVKNVVKTVFTAPMFDAILLGSILGIFGFGDWLKSSNFYGTYNALVNNISGSSGFLIILTVGYSFRIDRKNLKEILKTTIARIIVWPLAGLAAAWVVFRFIPYDAELVKVFIIAFTLPTSFGLLTFAKMEGNVDYISGVISMTTIVSFIAFALLVIFG